MTIDLPLPALLRNGKTNKHPLYPPFLEAGFLLLLALGYFQQPVRPPSCPRPTGCYDTTGANLTQQK
jgi:hypothetical protein